MPTGFSRPPKIAAAVFAFVPIAKRIPSSWVRVVWIALALAVLVVVEDVCEHLAQLGRQQRVNFFEDVRRDAASLVNHETEIELGDREALIEAVEHHQPERRQQSDPRTHPIGAGQVPDQVGGPLGGLGRVPAVLPAHGGGDGPDRHPTAGVGLQGQAVLLAQAVVVGFGGAEHLGVAQAIVGLGRQGRVLGQIAA